ncbi:MAG: L-lactate permease, partial [Gemmataceae bacterium]|nr:L-lactate permease [Gemmataceae bacterium]
MPADASKNRLVFDWLVEKGTVCFTLMAWTQVYDPFDNAWISTLMAALPTILLLGLLASGRVTAHVAALTGLTAALVLAILAYVPDMSGANYADQVTAWAPTMLAAALNGALFGLFPIGWIVLAAIFLYNLTVESGQFDIVKHSVASLSDDRRIQALLIAFSFGAFIEGAAGFGTPVAISAALMMGAGFKPLYAAGLALLANTSPVAFGALGTPIVTLANVTNMGDAGVLKLSAMAGRQLPFFSLIVPAWLVWVMAGWRGLVGVWPALLVCGGSFALVQFLLSNFHGPWLVDVGGGLVSLVSTALFLRIWRPKETWHFPGEELRPSETRPSGSGAHDAKDASPLPYGRGSEFDTVRGADQYTGRQVFSAWVPWLLLTVFVFLWGIQPVKELLGAPLGKDRTAFRKSPDQMWVEPGLIRFKVPGLHERIARDYPVVSKREPEPAVYEFNWLSATGTGIFFAAILSG